ncbi:MAG: outer membrane beta-barrel protein [Bacteroidota bacterium]
MSRLSSCLKTFLFTLLISCLADGLFAQSNFYKFSAGGGYGITLTFADAKKTSLSMAGYGNLDYYLTPYLTLGFEVQKGKLKGGEERDLTKFKNNYFTTAMNTKIHAGEFMTRQDLNNVFLNSIRGLYVGVGVGLIKSNVTNRRENSGGINKDVIFPFSAGINFYFQNHWDYSRFILNLSVQSTTSLEDGMDGDLNPFSNFNDIYSFFSIGFKYNFGPMGLDRKR